MKSTTRASAWLAIVFCLACSSHPPEKEASRGTIVIAASADPDLLLPPLTMSVQGKQISDQVFDNLADIGDGMNTIGDTGFRPRLAKTWRWAPDSTWIDFDIDPAARWHDGQHVDASDVRFTFNLVKDTTLGSQLAANVENVDSVSVSNSSTARVWLSKHPPDEFFRIASAIAILPGHLLDSIKPNALRTSAFARAPIGSGRFRFASWISGTSVALVADTGNYRGRPATDKVVWLVSPDYNGASLRFLSGQADFLDVVKPELVAKAVAAGRTVSTDVPGLNYGYVAFNLRDSSSARPSPIFSDRAVRRALVMSVDRASLVRNVFDTLALVAHGPVTRAIPTSDASIGLPYDVTAAAALLDSAGWKLSPTGIRMRNGKPLRFALMVPTSSAVRMRFAVLLQDQWKKIGADVRLDPIELSSFGARMEAHKFDALLNAWQIDPDPASVRDEWMSAAHNKAGFNFESYANPVVDAVLDSAVASTNQVESVRLYRKAYRVITDDAPALWLYESRNVFGISPRIETTGLRPDAWWAHLADWKVKQP
jgi:peptide/nickel transport system substrate-binding protein